MKKLRAFSNRLMRRDPLVVQAAEFNRTATEFERYIKKGAKELERAWATLEADPEGNIVYTDGRPGRFRELVYGKDYVRTR